MKLIEPAKPEILIQEKGFIGMCNHIARCASVCYDSKPKTGGDAVEFVRKLIKNGHGRALEFGTICFTENMEENGFSIPFKNPWIKYYDSQASFKRYNTTNLRFFLNAMFQSQNHTKALDLMKECWHYGLFDGSVTDKMCHNIHGGLEWNDMYPRRITIHFPAISRAIADEFRTHTTLSTMMRSTRYVDAMKGGDVEFIKPYWYSDEKPEVQVLFEQALSLAAASYKYIRGKYKLVQQNVRDILPLCVKTEMVMCGDVDAWKNFIALRTAPTAHPDAQRIAKEVECLLKEQYHEDFA